MKVNYIDMETKMRMLLRMWGDDDDEFMNCMYYGQKCVIKRNTILGWIHSAQRNDDCMDWVLVMTLANEVYSVVKVGYYEG